MAPIRPPISDELMNDPVVRAALEKAWLDSVADDPALRHEEGGWIYMDLTNGVISIRRAAGGAEADIDLTSPPARRGGLAGGLGYPQ